MFERFSKSARVAVVDAQETARMLGSTTIDVEHVLLGLLAAGDAELEELLAAAGLTHDGVLAQLAAPPAGAAAADEPLGAADAEALRSIGIDLDAVRESLEATFGADAWERAVPAEEAKRGRFGFGTPRLFGHIPFTRGAKKILELSLREALARDDGTIESAHILLAILRAPNETTARILGGGKGIEALRPKVHALLDQAA
ncbi:Clp protease N-terminal domain-containing protein [Nocardia sp. NPDC048505]|uniref:Clp protease N-terminal domain-containing protein n=1 Tax=unclassified Nocardia TaxID=2637762 RepID=UPI003403828F